MAEPKAEPTLVIQGERTTTVTMGNVPVIKYQNVEETVPVVINFLRSGCPYVQLLVQFRMRSSSDEQGHEHSFLKFLGELLGYLNSFSLSGRKPEFAVHDRKLIGIIGNGYDSHWSVKIGPV